MERCASMAVSLQVQPTAAGARNYSQCDSMLIGDRAGANTYPYIQVRWLPLGWLLGYVLVWSSRHGTWAPSSCFAGDCASCSAAMQPCCRAGTSPHHALCPPDAHLVCSGA